MICCFGSTGIIVHEEPSAATTETENPVDLHRHLLATAPTPGTAGDREPSAHDDVIGMVTQEGYCYYDDDDNAALPSLPLAASTHEPPPARGLHTTTTTTSSSATGRQDDTRDVGPALAGAALRTEGGYILFGMLASRSRPVAATMTMSAHHHHHHQHGVPEMVAHWLGSCDDP
jgi:hypothetical protein